MNHAVFYDMMSFSLVELQGKTKDHNLHFVRSVQGQFRKDVGTCHIELRILYLMMFIHVTL
jgi:hypothetical protein